MASAAPTRNRPRASGCRWSRVAHGAGGHAEGGAEQREAGPREQREERARAVGHVRRPATAAASAVQSMPWTTGVSPTMSPASPAHTAANGRGVRVSPMRACSPSSVTATFCSTSTARNERQRSSVANCKWTNLPIGKWTK